MRQQKQVRQERQISGRSGEPRGTVGAGPVTAAARCGAVALAVRAEVKAAAERTARENIKMCSWG